MTTKNINAFDAKFAKARRVGNIKFLVRKVYNWPDIFLLKAGIKKKVTLRMTDGGKIEVHGWEDFLGKWRTYSPRSESIVKKYTDKVKISAHDVDFDYKDRHLHFPYSGEDDLINLLGLIDEIYFQEEYEGADVNGRDVVDAGSSMCDAAMYFVINGAKHVFGYELNNNFAELGKRYAKENGLSDMITVNNEAFTKEKLIKLATDRNLQDAFLKIDIEGGEYDVILGSSKDLLRRFSSMIIEYHHGYKNLEDKLKECGFKVRHTAPDIHEGKDAMVVGLLYAKRVDKS